ncbi:uncharacterized protein LOC126263579 [Schistocerca nitens]|uniref:uncharacterized protein LOC126263579 n=1 Tax=Schistocerca nitens TaxID=7011 RepID=UPI00211960BD|nr:uncharacterized protein LOC126263579 [Schistocerca nitens]
MLGKDQIVEKLRNHILKKSAPSIKIAKQPQITKWFRPKTEALMEAELCQPLKTISATENHMQEATHKNKISANFLGCNMYYRTLALSKEEIQSTSIPRYSLTSFYCRNFSTHGDTAIFVKDQIKFSEVGLNEQIALSEDKEFELSMVKLPELNYIIINVYRAPSSNIPNFMTKLVLLNSVSSLNMRIILCGDFNIDLSKNSNAKLDLLNMTKSFNMIPTIHSSTRSTEHTDSIIDQIFITDAGYKFTGEVLSMGYSDHDAQLLSVDMENSKISPKKVFQRRNFSDGNIRIFNFLLAKENWDSVYMQTTVDNMFLSFHNTFLYYFNTAFPFETKTSSNQNRKSLVTKGIKISSERNRFLQYCSKKYIVTEEFSDYCKAYKKTYLTVIRQAKLLWNDNFIRNSSNKMNAMWKVIKKETCSSTPKKENISLTLNDSKVTDPYTVVNKFNEYFTSLAEDLIQANCKVSFFNSTNASNSTNATMFVYETNPDEIRNIIKLLPNKISSGYDEVPDLILKVCAPHIVKPLSTIYNQPLKTGIFPDALKIAKVSPLLKKGSPDLVSNYRPLSILSIFSKILEKLFYDRLINFIKNHAPISIQQHGFSKSLSTQTAIFELLDHILKSIDQHNIAAVPYVNCLYSLYVKLLYSSMKNFVYIFLNGSPLPIFFSPNYILLRKMTCPISCVLCTICDPQDK